MCVHLRSQSRLPPLFWVEFSPGIRSFHQGLLPNRRPYITGPTPDLAPDNCTPLKNYQTSLSNEMAGCNDCLDATSFEQYVSVLPLCLAHILTTVWSDPLHRETNFVNRLYFSEGIILYMFLGGAVQYMCKCNDQIKLISRHINFPPFIILL